MQRFIKISLFLAFGCLVTSCEKETSPANQSSSADTDATVQTNGVSDRNNTAVNAADMLAFSFNAGNAIDLQYRVTNSAETSRYYSFSFNSTVLGSTSSMVPGLDPCPKVQVRARRLYVGPGSETINWTLNRTTCSALTGTVTATAGSNVPWSSIPWVTIKEAACSCL